jgi:hypothetical protein
MTWHLIGPPQLGDPMNNKHSATVTLETRAIGLSGGF